MAEVNPRRRDLRDIGVEQAILSLKKGAYLLKCKRRGKPKLCPFRLSMDEKFLIWYVAETEKKLKLNSITRITHGQQTVNFLQQQLHEKENQSFSILYQNGKKSLDLICKDKEQAESWLLALNSLLAITQHCLLPTNVRNVRGSQTCSNSPISHSWRKQKIGYLDNSARFSRAHSLSGSPPRSFFQRHFSVSISYSYDHPYCSTPKPLPTVRTVFKGSSPHLPQMVYHNVKGKVNPKMPHNGSWKDSTAKIKSSLLLSPIEDSYILKDVFLWGKGTGGGTLGGRLDRSKTSCISNDSLLPKLLDTTRMLDVHSISCGRSHAAMVTKHGEIFTWGEGKGGRLGHKVDMDEPEPKVIDSLRDVSVDATSCGAYHTCALTSSGELYLWGSGCEGGEAFISGKGRSPWLPHRITSPLEGIRISRVACGEWHTGVITLSGQLFTFGDGTFGALGHGDVRNVNEPKQVESLKGFRVKSVACGAWHTAAIVEMYGHHQSNTPGGKLFTWGDNDKGKLGHADKGKKLFPTCVSSLVDCDFVQVSCGEMLTVALSVTGIIFTMGSSANGQLGNPLAVDKSITVVEGDLKNKHVKQISCGSAHVVVVTTKKQVYSWGKGANGRLGLGDMDDRNSPAFVETLKDTQVENITCGAGFTAAVCLHKTTLGFNQSVCTGCKMIFTFTRKKHNCYNCGFTFCSVCTSRKSTNASLAPNSSKQFRVCNPCYIQLNKFIDVNLKSDIQTPRALSWARKLFDTKAEGNKSLAVKSLQVSTCGNEHEETKFPERQLSANKGRSQDCHGILPVLSSRVQRWGEVPCRSQLIAWHADNPRISFSISSNDLSSFCNPHAVHKTKDSRSTETTPVKSATCNNETDAILAEELDRLQAEVKNLTKQCQVKSEKLLVYKQRIDETWAVARDEAAKCKAAKEIVKVLTSQINAMVGKFSAGKELNLKSILCEKLELRSPQIRPLLLEPMDSKQLELLSNVNNLSFNNQTLKPRKIDLLHDQSLRLSNASCDNSIAGGINICPPSQHGVKEEFVEQNEPGVYITFIRLPNGKKGLRRVRFSRKHFTQAEARRWWEVNQRRVYREYTAEQHTSSGMKKKGS